MRTPHSNDQTEAWVKKQVKKILDATGWTYWMPVAGIYGNNGISDFLCMKPPKLFMAIETKYDDVVTATQFKFLTGVHNAGHYAFVVDETNIDELRALLTNDPNLSAYPVGTLRKWTHQNRLKNLTDERAI